MKPQIARPPLGTVLCVLMLATAADAATVTLTDSAPQTISGQNFVFTFDSVPLSDGMDGTFRMHARGDYSLSTSTEFLTWNIDGLESDTTSPVLGATVLHSFGGNDVEWEETYTISGADVTAMTSDSWVTISVDLESAVNVGWAAEDWVEVNLTYTVPEPTTLSLMAVSGLAFFRHRRRRT